MTHEHNNFLQRNLDLPAEGNLIISGISQSGKTSFVFYSLNKLKEDFFYIDLDEIGVATNNWLELIKNQININKTLVLDIYYFKFIINYINELLLISKRIIIISWLPLKYDNFLNISVYPLNFEEFLLFKGSGLNLETAFVKYSHIGGFPILIKYPDPHLTKHLKRLLKFSLSEFDIDLLKDIADNIGTPRSILNMFESLKNRRAISKDKLYRRIDELIENGYIFHVKQFKKSSLAKYYLIDPALQNIFASKRDFSRLFEAMIISELAKRHEHEIIYYRNIEIYIERTQTAILPFPFAESSVFEKIITRTLTNIKKLKANNLQIITMDFEDSLEIHNIKFEAIKFTRWALTL